MRKIFLLALLGAASFGVAAQQPLQQPPKPAAQPADEKDTLTERERVEGAAGGTAPVPEEKRKAVGAGAGPHLRFERPSPSKLPKDEPVQPPK